MLLETLENTSGQLTSDRIFDEIKRMTKRDGKSYTEEDAIHEIVARASEDMFANSAAVQEILDSMTDEEKQTFVGKVKEILAQFKQWISEFLGLYKSDSEEAEALRKAADDIDALTKMWDDMLKKSLTANKALETAKARENKNSADKDGVVQYSDKSFAEQVDAVLAGIFDRTNAVYVGKTPKILQDVGLNGNLPMLTTANHIRNSNKPKNTAKHQHGLSRNQIKSIPDKIANPVIIMDALDESRSSIIVVTDMLDKDNSPIVVSVKTDGKGMYNNVEIKSNFLTSYYGRDAFSKFVEKNVAANTFLYINKEKAITLETESSTSWLEQLQNYDFDTIIRQTRANVNDKTVNNDDVQFAEKSNTTSFEADVDLTDNNELAARVAGMQGSKKYNTIRDYILESVGGYEFVLSDGIKAKVDKSDALHIANKSANRKTAYISKIKELIKKAKLHSIASNIVHNKFSEFRYYRINVKFVDEIYPIYLNVGKAKNGDGYHLYDITKKIGDFAKHNALERVNDDLRSEIESPISNYTQKNKKVKNQNNDYQTSDKTTENDTDILRSLLDEEELRSLKEREVLYQNKIKRLSEQLKAEKKKSKGKIYEHNLSGTAAHLLEHYGSKYKKSELVKDLDELYDRMIALPDTVKDFAYGIASKVYDGITEKKTVDENAASLLAELKTRRIKLDSEQLAEIENSHGDGWRTLFRNRVVIDNKNGTPLDEVWKELSDTYPDRFASDINSANQPE